MMRLFQLQWVSEGGKRTSVAQKEFHEDDPTEHGPFWEWFGKVKQSFSLPKNAHWIFGRKTGVLRADH